MIDEKQVWEGFKRHFFLDPDRLYSAHGRMEIIGNHTDHNHGLCILSGVDMGTVAAVRQTYDDRVRIVSKGYREASFDLLGDLSPNPAESHSSLSLAKGVMAKMRELGYKLGGFEAYLESDIFRGAGVSSSACFESLIAKIVDDLYNGNTLDPLNMAKISQYAENAYFGKPCGLLDQIGACYGGLCYVDFLDPNEPTVEPLEWGFPLHPVLINSGGSHAGLTPHYASISQDMYDVAEKMFGKRYLRDVSPAEFFSAASMPTEGVSEIAKLRATHFYQENRRVEEARQAVKRKDVATFLRLINESGYSSEKLLQNTMVPLHYPHSPQEAIDRLRPFLGQGAIRIMGGGFAGSVIAFLYPRDLPLFLKVARKYYGAELVKEAEMAVGGPRRLK